MNAFGLRGLISLLVSLSVGLVMGQARGHFGVSLLDAICVGMGCWFCVDTSRGLVGRLRWRRLGLDHLPGPQPDGTFPHWPGWGWMTLCMTLGTAVGGSAGVWASGHLAVAGGLVADLPAWWTLPGHGLMDLTFSLLGTLGVAVAIALFFYAREQMALSQKEAEEAKRLAAESQLRLLQAQLEPHMLFNTLANLRVLIGLDPGQAQGMLDHLIRFLRATLQASRRDAHSLADEFTRLRDYLSLMQIRMGSRLSTHLHLPDDLRDYPVPPLLLQPLVENAILHGLEPKLEGGALWVEAGVEADPVGVLRIRVRDSGLGLHRTAEHFCGSGGGFGVQQVRDRLAVTWGELASLTLKDAVGGGTEAVLILPLNSGMLTP